MTDFHKATETDTEEAGSEKRWYRLASVLHSSLPPVREANANTEEAKLRTFL